jgi:hypothetical protein
VTTQTVPGDAIPASARPGKRSDAQTGAVAGVAAALLGMFVRSQVTPLIQSAAGGRRLIPALDQTGVAPAPPAGR